MVSILVEVKGLQTFVDFEFIEIIDDTNPYPTLLGINWKIENQIIINFKKRLLTFENGDIIVIPPLDPLEGLRYVKPVKEEYDACDLENIYNISSRLDDYVNPTTNVTLRWCSGSACS